MFQSKSTNYILLFRDNSFTEACIRLDGIERIHVCETDAIKPATEKARLDSYSNDTIAIVLNNKSLKKLYHMLSSQINRETIPEEQCIKNIYATTEFIKTNFDRNISIDRLAGIANMSRSGYFSSFKKLFGLSPIQYLIEYRVKMGCEKLVNTDKSIINIALEIGFTDSNYFSRKFKSIMRVSPSEYRKQNRITLYLESNSPLQ